MAIKTVMSAASLNDGLEGDDDAEEQLTARM